LNSSYITIKIKGSGNKNIFCPTDSFHEENRPDIIKINNQIKTPVYAIQNLNSGTNTVILEWTRDREDYSHIFHGCPDIIKIDLSNFKTSQAKYMGSMFRGCSSLTSINFANFDSNSAEDMGAMFFGCKKLTSINLFWFDTSRVTFMWNMFAECSSLTSLDLYYFDTKKVEYMWGMFSDCTSLTSLDLSRFDTSLVTEMGELFKNCINLEYIDMFNFKESNLNHAGDMFASLPNNLVVCINRNNIQNKILDELETKQCYTVDCSSNWKLNQRKIIKNIGQ
jgi:surface protein